MVRLECLLPSQEEVLIHIAGMNTATIPVWQSELSGAQHRGAFVNAEGIFLGLGIVVALLIERRST